MPKKDKSLTALEIVHAALKPLKPEERQRVLASVDALLDVLPAIQPLKSDTVQRPPTEAVHSTASRPLAIRELIQDKHPRTHPQFITLFAYYREKYQNLPTFSRDALEKYYSDSHETPPANYGRDFVKAISKGWIHEDGENSYITSKGLEAVETGFSREVDAPSSARRPKPKAASKAKTAKKPRRN